METGRSKHWKDVLKELSDGKVSKLDASAILEYFEPVHSFLKEQRKLLKYPVGWDGQEFLEFYRE